MLVHFLDFAQLNSVRALPYVVAWEQRYRDLGLGVLGVHSARSALTADPGDGAEALARLGVRHPVAADVDYAIWHDYGCEGWPSLFVWGRGGALRWFHFGEGAYAETELAIQEELAAVGRDSLPAPLPPMRPTDAPDATVVVPTREHFPGGSIEEPWDPADGDRSLALAYEAGGAYASADGAGELDVALDGSTARRVAVAGPGLYQLAEHSHHERHELLIDAPAGVRIWSVSFAPGLPSPGRERRR